MSNNISTTLEFAMSLAAIIDNDEGSMRSDLKCSLVRTENRYGTGSPASRREKRLRHNMPNGSSLAISDGEIDLDAGNDPDEWNVYLMSIPQTKNLQRND